MVNWLFYISAMNDSDNCLRLADRVDEEATIESFSVVGEFCSIDYQGDYEDILNNLNNAHIGSTTYGEQQFNCSLYTGSSDPENIFMGRNFDNPTCDLLVGRYSPPDGYRSIAMTRISDLQIPQGTDYENMSSALKQRLLKAPFFTADGMNEMGVAAGLAYVEYVPITIDPEKETIWLTYWLRKILDSAASVEEAVQITNSYNIVDNFYGPNTLCHHILVSDSNGNSAILEYHEDQFVAISSEVPWQVLTNSPIHNVPLQTLLNQCWRYQILYNSLLQQNGIISDWRNGMDILSRPSWGDLTNGTQWSSLFDLNENQVFVSVYRDYLNIAAVDIDTFDFINYGKFYLNETIIQDSNNNGIYETNETLLISAAITADFNSYGVMGFLSVDDSEAIVLNSVSDFGDVIPNEVSINLESPFQLQLPSYFESEEISLKMNLVTAYGHSHEINFSIPVSNTSSDENTALIDSAELIIYPNPIGSITSKRTSQIYFQIKTDVKISSEASLEIFNLKGQKIKSHQIVVRNDSSTISWDGRMNDGHLIPSGVYFCLLRNNGKTLASRKMVVFR